MKLEKFDKNKNKKRILIGSLILILLLIGGINLYRTFALYEEKKEFNVLRGRVPKFGSKIQYYLDDVPQESAPVKGAYGVKVSCDKEVEYSWNREEWKLNLPEGIKTISCDVKFYTMPDNFSGYIMKLSFFDDSVIQDEHAETTQTGANAKTDYRYVGANPNNYVCLEANGNCKTEEGEIDNNKLYRIIGVIPTQSSEDGEYKNRVKLIKATSIGGYIWSGSSTNKSNNWTASTLNTQILNQTYWTGISSYQKYIDPTKWYLGGFDLSVTISNIYIAERGSTGGKTSPTTISTIANIGLIYLSDYGYATSGGTTGRKNCLDFTFTSGDWGNTSNNTNKQCRLNDWLYTNSDFWTITPGTGSTTAWYLDSSSIAQNTLSYHYTSLYGILPVFHLKADVEYNGGDGSYNNPYTIKLGS